eukprot:scaffold12434_cov177-Amphora_coffeaeformis.AAC.4
MNDYREADFVVNEMLPLGHYEGRLTLGVAHHLARRVSQPSVVIKPSLVLDLQIESIDAFRTFVRALATRKHIKGLKFISPISLACLAVLAETFQPWELEVLEVTIDEPTFVTSDTDIAYVFRRLADLCTTNLDLNLKWQNIDAMLLGLSTSGAPTTHQPRVSLSLAYYDASTWEIHASQIQNHPFVRDLTIRGGEWGPAAWSGLILCLQTPSLRGLTLLGVTFRDQRVPIQTVRALEQALHETTIRDFQLIDIQGSTRGGSLELMQTLLASMVSHEQDDKDAHCAKPACPIQSLTLRTQLSVMMDDDFMCASHALLAKSIPRMRNLRTLHTRWHPNTSALLWGGIQSNQSLTEISAGKMVGRMLEPVLQRNRLLRATQTYSQTARTLEEVVDFAQHHFTQHHGATDAVDPAQDTITASAAYWLLRTCLPHNCRRACGDVILASPPPTTMLIDDESMELDEDNALLQDAVDMMMMS